MTNKRLLIISAIAFAPVVAEAQQSRLNCDSTCIVANPGMIASIPKANTVYATPIIASPTSKPICGSSAGSVLPSAPTSFLCTVGTPSGMRTTNIDGETSYSWSCGNSLGTQACMAAGREVGACGPSHGQTLSSNPTNLCNGGEAVAFSFVGNTYSWQCRGNYGSPAYCAATYYNPPPAPQILSKYIIHYGDNMFAPGPALSTFTLLSATEGYVSTKEGWGSWGRCRYAWQDSNQVSITPLRMITVDGVTKQVLSLNDWNRYTYWYGYCLELGS